MKTIAIRADGSKNIGMGHIMRSLVLAKELAKSNNVFYICRDSSEYKLGRDKVKEYFDVVKINDKNILEGMKNIKADVLLTDSYDVNNDYFKFVNNQFSINGYVDDMNLYDFSYIDFIINQNYCAEKIKYKSHNKLKLLCGSQYTMLREEFRCKPKISINNEVKRIGITFGGTDALNLTLTVMEYLQDSEYEIHVVANNSFKEFETIVNMCEKYPGKFVLYINPYMSEFLSNIDVLISASGSTLYEAAVLGVPTISVVIADNQVELEKNMSSFGLVDSIGTYEKINKDVIMEKIYFLSPKEKREVMQKKQEIINPLGVFNIINSLKKEKFID